MLTQSNTTSHLASMKAIESQKHFSRGIITTPSDFSLEEPPFAASSSLQLDPS